MTSTTAPYTNIHIQQSVFSLLHAAVDSHCRILHLDAYSLADTPNTSSSSSYTSYTSSTANTAHSKHSKHSKLSKHSKQSINSINSLHSIHSIHSLHCLHHIHSFTPIMSSILTVWADLGLSPTDLEAVISECISAMTAVPYCNSGIEGVGVGVGVGVESRESTHRMCLLFSFINCLFNPSVNPCEGEGIQEGIQSQGIQSKGIHIEGIQGKSAVHQSSQSSASHTLLVKLRLTKSFIFDMFVLYNRYMKLGVKV